mgnify:CR=1 FL=1
MSKNHQKTINEVVKLSGVGLHNGLNVNLTIRPAEENFGIKFCRTDVDKENLIKYYVFLSFLLGNDFI